MKNKNTIFYTLILLFLTFCVQFTDLKIGVVKITELLALAVAPLILLGKLHKYIVYLLLFFTTTALISLWVTSYLDFTYLQPSFFKRPYWITLGRYLEIVSCLILCNITFLYFKSLKKNKLLDNYLQRFIDLNIAITIVFAFVYLLVVFNVISMDTTRLVYGWDTRLRGYFVEGGPYGLMLSFIFMLAGATKNKKGMLIRRLLLFVVIFFMAQSKSGILSCVIWLGVENFTALKNKLRPLLLPLAALFVIGFLFLFKNIGHMYINEIDKIKISVKEKPHDPNLIMGRISGFFIAPKIVKDHALIGIGTGNYPLLRNNKEYRSFFPLPPKKIRNLDAHGYGGIMDILVDNGLFGLVIFLFIIGKLFQKTYREKGKSAWLVGFILLFLFGVQIHFMYPWILLGLVLVPNKKDEESLVNDLSLES